MRIAGLWMCKMFAVLVALTAGCATADASPARKKPSRPRLNLPPGWTWPPNPEMEADGKACLARITRLGVKWEDGPPTPRIATPIVVPGMTIGGVKLTPMWRKGEFPMDCHLALAFAEKGAAALRRAGVVELRFSGIHSYRKVAGTKILSRHALGLAIDVFDLVDADGTRHAVEGNYRDGDRLLWTVEDSINDTGAFRMLLTPGNDPEHHHDHFHFEARTTSEAIEPPLRIMARPLDRSEQ